MAPVMRLERIRANSPTPRRSGGRCSGVGRQSPHARCVAPAEDIRGGDQSSDFFFFRFFKRRPMVRWKTSGGGHLEAHRIYYNYTAALEQYSRVDFSDQKCHSVHLRLCL